MKLFLILPQASFAFCILSPTASFKLLFVFMICPNIFLVCTHSILLYGSLHLRIVFLVPPMSPPVRILILRQFNLKFSFVAFSLYVWSLMFISCSFLNSMAVSPSYNMWPREVLISLVNPLFCIFSRLILLIFL